MAIRDPKETNQFYKMFSPSWAKHPRKAPAKGPTLEPALPVARVVEITTRGGEELAYVTPKFSGETVPATLGAPLDIGDKVTTGPFTYVGIEFVIGGRVAVDHAKTIEVVTERSIAMSGQSVTDIIWHKVGVWQKCAKMRAPLEIQTNGGVMGIKG